MQAVDILSLIDLALTVLSLVLGGCGALLRTLHEPHVRTRSDFEMGARRSRIFYQKYPRDHTWIFEGGHTMTATAAPAISVVRRMLIPRRRSSPHSQAVTCLRFW